LIIKMRPLVTVYITNFNYGDYIEDAINSVLDQSYENIELLIIDDGSTDNSRLVIEKYSGVESITAIFQENRGLTRTNNTAIAVSKGEFIVRLDADDRFYEDAITNLLSGFDNDNVAMVFGNWNVVNKEGEFLFSYKRHDFQQDVTLLDSPAHGACTMFRADYLELVGGYNEDLSCQDGYELWFRIIDKFQVKSIDSVIFDYRQHGDNLTSNEDKILTTRAAILQDVAKNRNSKSTSTFCVIPVRGTNIDSRSRPFQPLNGKYLIDHVLEYVVRAQVFAEVIVSTPDQGLIEYVTKKYKGAVSVHGRELALSQINTSIDDVLMDLLNDTSAGLELYDYGMLLSADRPFNKRHLFQSAIDIAKIFNVDNVIGVRPNNDVFFSHNGSTLKGINFSKSSLRLERDDLYQMVRGFNLFSVSSLKTRGSLWGDVIGHVVLDQKTAFTLDSDLDLVVATALLERD